MYMRISDRGRYAAEKYFYFPMSQIFFFGFSYYQRKIVSQVHSKLFCRAPVCHCQIVCLFRFDNESFLYSIH